MKIVTSLPAHLTLTGLARWLADLAAAIAAGWRVQHDAEGVHVFPWIDITASAANFTGFGAMTWTLINQRILQYRLIGTTMTIAFDIEGTVGGTPNAILLFTVPLGRHAAHEMTRSYTWNNGAVTGTGIALSTDTQIGLYVDGIATVWVAGTARVRGTIEFEVKP